LFFLSRKIIGPAHGANRNGNTKSVDRYKKFAANGNGETVSACFLFLFLIYRENIAVSSAHSIDQICVMHWKTNTAKIVCVGYLTNSRAFSQVDRALFTV
jgi:hypothetical protein